MAIRNIGFGGKDNNTVEGEDIVEDHYLPKVVAVCFLEQMRGAGSLASLQGGV